MKVEKQLCRKVTVETAEHGPVVVVLIKGPHGGVMVRAELRGVLSRWSWNDLGKDMSDTRYANEHVAQLGLTLVEAKE